MTDPIDVEEMRHLIEESQARKAAEQQYESEERAAIEHDEGPIGDYERKNAAESKPKPKPLVDWKCAQDIFAQLSPAKWVSHQLQIGPGRPALFAGYGASGKTLASQSMALSIATGSPIWGKFPSAIGRVVHADLEQGFRATARRYQRLAAGMGIQPPEIGENLLLASLPSLYLTERKGLLEYARIAEGSVLVIIDSLRASAAGLDENGSRIRKCLDALTRISERTGCAFWVLHHAGKPRDGHDDQRTIARGSSAIFDACGAVYVISGGKSEPKSVSMQKTPPDAEGAALEDFRLAIDDVYGGVRVTALDATVAVAESHRVVELRDRIVEYLSANPSASKRAVRAEVGGYHRSVDDQLDWLVTAGRIAKAEGKLGGYVCV
jgi:hypothetical protein